MLLHCNKKNNKNFILVNQTFKPNNSNFHKQCLKLRLFTKERKNVLNKPK